MRNLFRMAAIGGAMALATAGPSAAAVPSAVAEAMSERGEIHLALYNGENRDGFMRLGWYRDGETLVVYDRSMLPSGEIYETFSSRMDAATLAPQSIELDFHAGAAVRSVDLSISEGRVSGAVSTLRPGVGMETNDVDLALPEGTIFRAMSFILPLHIEMSEGERFDYTWLAPMSAQAPIANVSLTHSGVQTIETASGNVEAVKYELRGSAPDNDIYVSTGQDRQIVRIDVVGTPLVFHAMPPAN